MNSLRLSGLASGMDTETMIKDLMRAERVKADKFSQNKQVMQWRREQYNSVNKDFANFVLDMKKELELTRSTIFGTSYNNSMANLSWVKKASSSNDGIFTTKAMANAMGGTHQIKVKALAKGVQVASTGDVETAPGVKATASTKLQDLGVAAGNHTLEFKIDGVVETVKIDYKATDTISTLTQKINTAVAADTNKTPLMLQANFDNTTGRLFLSTKNTGENAKIQVVSDSQKLLLGAGNKFKIASTVLQPNTSMKLSEFGITGENGVLKLKLDQPGEVEKTITFTKDSTILNVIDAIDALNLNGVTATFVNGRLQITGQDLQIVEDNKGLLSKEFKVASVLGDKTGENAKIDYNGVENLAYSSNTFMINGIEINLHSLPSNINEAFTINVTTDTDSVMGKIRTFVDKYNEMIEKLNSKIKEKRYREFLPLTSEQKESMKEDDIKKWEEKAKSGLLRGDGYIANTLQTMRSGLYEKVVGDDISARFNHITSIGISTGDFKNNGKLEIDDTKLKNAILQDVEGVLNLLFKQSTTNEGDGTAGLEGDARKAKIEENRKKIRSESGLINRLFSDVVAGMKGLIDKSGTGDDADLYRKVQSNILIDFVTGKTTGIGSISFIEQDVMRIDKSIAREERRLADKEKRYWDKFTAMEKAMQKMNSQSSWLMQQLNGGK